MSKKVSEVSVVKSIIAGIGSVILGLLGLFIIITSFGKPLDMVIGVLVIYYPAVACCRISIKNHPYCN